MINLQFIGTGSAFNTELGNTSAFIKNHNSILLIDCGGTVFHRIQELNLFDKLENLYIIITHTHPDHVGSLGDIIFYSYYILKITPIIFFPNKEVLEKFLSSIGVNKEIYLIVSNNSSTISDIHLGNIDIEFSPVSHVDTIPSYGFVLKSGSNSIYYSGDSNLINNKILEKFYSNEINIIYHDTCGLDYVGNAHLSLNKLSKIIPKEFRSRVYCMHLDKHICPQEILNTGFNIAHKI